MFADEPELPKLGASQQVDAAGMRMVERIVGEELGWIFRDERLKDFGIDGLIEVVRSTDGGVTGRLVAMQLKSGASAFSEPARDGSGYVFRGDAKHLEYWLGHSLPVILILCDPGAGRCIYSQITAGKVQSTGAGWKTVVPSHQTLGTSAKTDLIRVAGRDPRQNLISLAILDYLINRWGHRLHVLTVAEMPRDFHHFPHLVHIVEDTGGLFAVQYIDTTVRSPSAAAIAEEVKWRDYNRRAANGDIDLMLLVIGEDAASTELGPDARELCDRADVRVSRLVLDTAWGADLTDIDDDGEPIWFWPGDDEPVGPPDF